MTAKPLVSVLMTAFNREKYISYAIESVLAQTYSNWELIIVDDLSTDRTLSIANDYSARDSRIFVYQNSKNLGDYVNRNMSASKATGKYLKYLDSDDFLYPWALELMVFMMEKNPEARWGLCSLPPDKNRPYPYLMSPRELYLNCYYNGATMLSKSPLSSIILKSAFDEVGGFSGKQHLGDFELWHALGRYYPLLLMPHGMVWYREHDQQESSDNRNNPFVPFKYLVEKIILINHKDCPLNLEERKYITANTNRQIARAILKEIIHLNTSCAIRMIRYSKIGLIKLLLNIV